MLNDFLLSFFLVVPSYVAVIVARQQPHPLSRFILFWGGAICSLLVTLALLPAFLCGGGLYDGYASCLGGDGLAAAFNSAAPLVRLILLGYVLIAPLMALLVFALNWSVKRTRSAASVQG